MKHVRDELRHGGFGTPAATASPDLLAQLTPGQFFDALAIRVDGPRSWNERVTIDWDLTGTATSYRVMLRNGALSYSTAPQATPADAIVHLPAAALASLAAGETAPGQLAAAGVQIEGDTSALRRLLTALDAPDPNFAIVTP